MEFARLTPCHDDTVTDISFDYYGKRFATCSTDKHIKVWTLLKNSAISTSKSNNSTGNINADESVEYSWSCHDISSAHSESIWRVCWSHPEFGSLIASCSEDRTVCIWEQQENITSKISKDKWICKAKLHDAKRAINDVKFSPRHLGLRIATASAEGIVRIYDSVDLFSLSYWNHQVRHVFYVGG